jgi:hypothetical protein
MNKSIFTLCISYSCLNNHTCQKDGNTVEIYQSLCVVRIEFKTILKSDPTTDFSSGSKVTWTKAKRTYSQTRSLGLSEDKERNIFVNNELKGILMKGNLFRHFGYVLSRGRFLVVGKLRPSSFRPCPIWRTARNFNTRKEARLTRCHTAIVQPFFLHPLHSIFHALLFLWLNTFTFISYGMARGEMTQPNNFFYNRFVFIFTLLYSLTVLAISCWVLLLY